MVTEVIMKRTLLGGEVSQKSKSEFFSATDLINIGNKHRRDKGLSVFNFSAFMNSKSTKEFITTLEYKYGIVLQKGKSKKSSTWVHPLLFIDIALAINPELKVEVYEWLFDHLIKNRNDSGDSYKKMSSALYSIYGNKKDFPVFIRKLAEYIRKELCKADDWQSATQEQLKLRDKYHNSIELMCNVLSDARNAAKMGIAAVNKQVSIT